MYSLRPFLLQRRDSTCIFYDILFLARKGVTKTLIRRELGLSFRRAEERLSFLLQKGHLRRESKGGPEIYNTTMKGYNLLYFMCTVDEEIGTFFLNRKGKRFANVRGAEVEGDLTDLLFNLQSEETRKLTQISRVWSDPISPNFPSARAGAIRS